MRYVLTVKGDNIHDANDKFKTLVTALHEQADDPTQIRVLGGLQVEAAGSLGESVDLKGTGLAEGDLVHVGTVSEPGDSEPETEDVHKMTKDELVAYADEHGIDLGGARTKDEIIKTIQKES